MHLKLNSFAEFHLWSQARIPVQMKLTLLGPYCQANVLWPNEFPQQELVICDCPFGGSIDMCTAALLSTANHVRLNAPVPYKQDGWGACVILYATCKGCSNFINREENKPYKPFHCAISPPVCIFFQPSFERTIHTVKFYLIFWL